MTTKEENTPNYWLLVERLENWEIDEKEGFYRFGLSKRMQKTCAPVKAGDLLIIYLSSGISVFSDIRVSTINGTIPLEYGGDYDTAYPFTLKTKPRLILPKERWVPLKSLKDELSFTKDKTELRQVMRLPIRRLSENDGKIIVSAMEKSYALIE